MATLSELSGRLERALAAGDLDLVARERAAIAVAFPESEQGAEAAYKLGLDALYRRRDLEAAALQMRAAAKVKGVYGALARSALGLILLRQGKAQQAIFELRKVASTTPPTIVSASAYGLLVYALRETKQLKEGERARVEHKRVLAKLTESANAEDAALAHFQLGVEHKFDGDRALAKRHLQAATQGSALPARERALALAALAEV